MNNFSFTIETAQNYYPQIIKPTPPQIISPATDIITVEAEIIPNTTNLLGWEVLERPVFNSKGKPIAGFKELVRSDNDYNLNICKEKYTPTPNGLFSESIEFLQNVSGLKLDTIEELKGGKILLAKLWNAEPVNICGHNYNTYMVIGNSHNYESTFFIGEYNTMMRCRNQYAHVNRDLKAWHTTGHADQVKRLLTYYQVFKDMQQNTIQLMQRLETTTVNQQTKDRLIKQILSIPVYEDFNKLSKRKQNIVNTLQNSINMEMRALGPNAFGLFNGVTHFTTHERREKDKVYSRFFGSSADINNKALKFLKEM